MALPINLTVPQMQTKWKSQLDPLIDAPQASGRTLQNQKLISGTNTINHGLGQKLQGWYIVRRRQFVVTGTPTAYDIYDTQDSNQMQALTLVLTCSQGTSANPVDVDIFVY